MSWIDFLDRSVSEHSDKLAVVDQRTGRRLSYTDLQSEVNRWANYFESMNISMGERVAFWSTNCLEHITMFFACAKIGAIFVPLNFRMADKEVHGILKRINPSLTLYRGEIKMFSDHRTSDIESIDLEKFSNNYKTINQDLNIPLLMLFTSGTTGTPKGVMFHGEMLETNQISTCEEWGLVSEDVCLVETPFFHTGGYNVLCLPLLFLGGTVVLAQKFEIDNVYRTFEQEKITVYFGVPTMFQFMSEDNRFKDFEFTHIRFFISGGAHCPLQTIETYQKKGLMFKQGFGLTEVGPNCFLLSEEDCTRKLGSIGRPMGQSSVLLIDSIGSVISEPHEIGELAIKGKHLCLGYYEDMKQFNDSLSQGYFRTGDLARFDSEGFFYIVGRKKEMYISGGENVYPSEVEKEIALHDLVDEVVVVSVDDERWGEVGFAFYRGSDQLAITHLREYLNPLLSRYKHPHYLENLAFFPELANGKIDKVSLSKKANDLANDKFEQRSSI